MNTYIALIRGINVGGHKKFPKADQLSMMKALHMHQPQLYIHTGNWVFQSTKSVHEVAQMIQHKIETEMGWKLPVIVFNSVEFSAIIANCPFSEATVPQDHGKKEASYFVMLEEEPTAEKWALLEEVHVPNEEFVRGERCIYFYPSLGAGKAKLSNNFFENKLKVNATTRNFRTMAKLLSMATS